MIDRAGLADFLRRRRGLLRPSDVGLPEGARRRTPGLRRDEVAHLADMSSDYYSRLEQGRGSHPSAAIIAALTRALRCDLDESDHLFHLAGFSPPQRRSGSHLRPGLLSLVERLVDVPVCICTDIDEVIWLNTLAQAVLGLHHSPPGRTRNLTWRWFTESDARTRFPEKDWADHSAAYANNLRATYSRRAGDQDVAVLVYDLLERSTEFRALWERHEVAVCRYDRIRTLHPEVGLLHLTCEMLLTPEADLRVLTFLPTEATDAREKLELLRVVGTQNFDSAV